MMKHLLITALLISQAAWAQDAQTILQSNGCLNCHAIASKKAAPAFAGIAKRNRRFEGANAKATIMNAIKNGSKGKYPMFADSAMPAFKNLSSEELSTLADYILAQASKANCQGHGGGMGREMGRGMGRGKF